MTPSGSISNLVGTGSPSSAFQDHHQVCKNSCRMGRRGPHSTQQATNTNTTTSSSTMAPKSLPFFLELPHADVQLDLTTLSENGAGENEWERNADIHPKSSITTTTTISNRQPFLLHPRPAYSLQDEMWGGFMLDPTQHGGSGGRKVNFTTRFLASGRGGSEEGSDTPCTGFNHSYLTCRTAPRDLSTPSTPAEDGWQMLVHHDKNMDAKSDPTETSRFFDKRTFSTPTRADSSFNQTTMAQYSPSMMLYYTPTTMHNDNDHGTMARSQFTADPGPVFSPSNHLPVDDNKIALATAFSTPLPQSLTLQPRPRNVMHENGGSGVGLTDVLRPGIGHTEEGPGAGGPVWLDSRMVDHNIDSASTNLSLLWNLEMTGTSSSTKMTTLEDPEEVTVDYTTVTTAGRTIGGNQNLAHLEHLFPPLLNGA